MWAQPDGTRVLLAPDDRAAAFIGAVYCFDRVEVVDLIGGSDARGLEITAGGLRLSMTAGPGWRIPLAGARPPWVTRWVEAPLARALFGVRAYGVSPTGVREWYRADEHRPVTAASAAFEGADLGLLADLVPDVGFGFSSPPRRPSFVAVRPLLQDPTGRLDRVIAGLR